MVKAFAWPFGCSLVVSSGDAELAWGFRAAPLPRDLYRLWSSKGAAFFIARGCASSLRYLTTDEAIPFYNDSDLARDGGRPLPPESSLFRVPLRRDRSWGDSHVVL